MAGTPSTTRLPEARGAEARTVVWRDRLERLMPAALRSHEDDFDRTIDRRTKRTWLGDIVAAVSSLMVAVGIYFGSHADGHTPDDLLIGLNLVFVPISIVLLFWRRQYPFRIAVVLAVVACIAPASALPGLIALFAVAAYSRPAVGVLGIFVGLLTAPIAPLVWPHASGDASFWTNTIFGAIITLGVGAWGLFAGARRQLLGSLRERAARAESEQQMRVDQARQAERTRIAREMHDVLAHRMSLLSVHAGALEYRPDASPEEVARAAGVIRATAHEALEELRTVIGVLRVGDAIPRATEAGGVPTVGSEAAQHSSASGTTESAAVAQSGLAPEPPQPTLAALPHLIEEWRGAGARIVLHDGDVDLATVPQSVGRTAYRIVQEALTNAGKHAPTTKVTVVLAGRPGDSLRISVTNPLAIGDDALTSSRSVPIPGTGLGLVGVRERAELAGGAFAAGIDDDLRRFVLEAQLPWVKA